MSIASKHSVTELRSSIASLHDTRATLPVEVDHLVAAAEQVADEADRAMGSCERGRPFADMFVVATARGTLVWRCMHDPAHPDLPWR